MIISHKYKFIFIKNVKTAGTSIETYLRGFCGEDDICTPIADALGLSGEYEFLGRNYKGIWNPISDIFVTKGRILRKRKISHTLKMLLKRNKFYNHMPGILVRNRISKNIWNNYFKFCVERNPWDKTFSHYCQFTARNPGYSLNDYFSRKHFPINHVRYLDLDGKIIVNKIIKYENLNEELSEVFSFLGIPFDGNLSIRARSGLRKDKRPYHEVLTTHQRDVIYDSFANEIQLHGYQYRAAI